MQAFTHKRFPSINRSPLAPSPCHQPELSSNAVNPAPHSPGLLLPATQPPYAQGRLPKAPSNLP